MLMALDMLRGTRGWVAVGGLFVCLIMGQNGRASAQAIPDPGKGAGAVKTTVMEPLTPLLPDRFSSWSRNDLAGAEGRSMTNEQFNEATCLPILPTDAREAGAGAVGNGAQCLNLLAEDGLLRFAATRYANGGAGLLDAYAEQFGDATGAYSAYTFYRTKMRGSHALSGEHMGKEAIASGDATLILAETSLLWVQGKGVTRSELNALVAGLPKVGGRKGLSPLLPTYLPPKGLDKANVRYALGPVGYQAMSGVLSGGMLSWDKSAEAVTAHYAGGSGQGRGEGTLTLLLYPTPQIAADRGRVIEKAVNDAGASSFGTVRMRRVGPLIGMTSGALSAAQAQALTASLHLSEEVTFDQKMPLEFHAEVKKTASLLENIAVLCGVLVLGAVLLGLFLGGARAGIRVLQGKSAASEPEFLTINLRDQPRALFRAKENSDELPG